MTTDHTALVSRLREPLQLWYLEDERNQAAYMIEQQAREIAALKTDLRVLTDNQIAQAWRETTGAK